MPELKSEISSVHADPMKSLEEEISKSVRSDRVTGRATNFTPPAEEVGEPSAIITEFVQDLGATSIAEIDKLIADLQAARNYLKAESDRIQQEMTRYAHLSDTASASVRIITESLVQWGKGSHASPEVGIRGQMLPDARSSPHKG